MNFIKNKYLVIYHNIIDRARNRKLSGYVERHHIIPRSCGGTDYDDNIVELTAREHYICHRLLTKITTEDFLKKMIYAQFMMTASSTTHDRSFKITARTYQYLKEEFNKINPFKNKQFIDESVKRHTGSKRSLETREKLKNSWTAERKEKSSEKYKGKRFGGWPAGKPKPHYAGENNPFYGKSHSEEFLKKRREDMVGKPPPFASIKKICEHCGRSFNLGNYTQFHGSKCKLKSTI